jgi:serine/threonine protein kinase
MILDFGMAVIAEATARWASRLTLRGQLQGTLAYSAPEQLRGEDATPAADIYAWALISIEMLTGKLVMAGATIHETLDRQLGPEPVPIPGELEGSDLGSVLREGRRAALGQRRRSARPSPQPVRAAPGTVLAGSLRGRGGISAQASVAQDAAADLRGSVAAQPELHGA